MPLRTLYQTLLDSDLARLQVIARLWEIELRSERRVDAAAELADAMARSDAVDRVLPRLTEDQRAALDDLLRRGGQMPWAAFARRWGQIRAIGPGRLVREELWRAPISAAEGLWFWGFLQRAFVDRPGGPLEVAFVPSELALYIPPPPPQDLPPPTPVAPPLHTTFEADSLADDLVILWAVLQAEPIPPLAEEQAASGVLPDGAAQMPAVRAMLARMHAPARRRLPFLYTLAMEQGWVRVDERRRLRPVPDRMLPWLRAGVWEQWTALARAWMESRRWNDLAAVPTLAPDPRLGWPHDAWAARQEFLAVLRQCTPQAWYAVETFAAYVREHAPDFLRADGDYESWAPRDALTGAALRGFEAWVAVEGALVAYYLTGPLAWLGVVELGRASPDMPYAAFRLSEAGAALLGMTAPPSLPDVPPIRLRGDGTLLIPPRRRYAHFQLSRVARFVAVEGGAYRYRLTPASLARARQQRIPPERIIAFLEEATAAPLPRSLRRALLQAYGQGERVRLARTWVLRARDPALLDLPALQRYVQERLGPGAATIRVEDRDRVLSLLIREGVLPEFVET